MIAVSGYLLGAEYYRQFDVVRLAGLVAGMALVIASACVFNNLIDQGIDAKMSRTGKRALVTGKISELAALIYGAALGGAGFAFLIAFTNHRVVWLNAVAELSYVFIYGWAKRKTVHGTLVGTVPGAIPPAAGYAAAGRLNRAALIYFLILVFWQMAHFYSIALYRQKDYKAAGLPVMPVKYGAEATKLQVLLYIVALTAACLWLSASGFTGYIFAILISALCLYWFWSGWESYKKIGFEKWGRKMFGLSLIVLMGLAVLIPLGSVLPWGI